MGLERERERERDLNKDGEEVRNPRRVFIADKEASFS
jgi:hypothetical protein